MNRSIFEGIKVADFSWVAVVPLTIRYLADHGATVIKVESRKRPDILRYFPPFKDNIQDIDHNCFSLNYNCNKYGITLDMNNANSKDVAKRILTWADVVAESYVPGVMGSWGLTYQDIIKFNSKIIMLSANMQGQTGPRRGLSGYGTHLASLSGFTALMGWPDRKPSAPYGAYTDFIVPKYAITALVAALLHRHETGEGQYLDISQYEVGLQFLSSLILDYQANRTTTERQGNRDDVAAPHGVYPTKGNDSWIAIAVFTDTQWHSLSNLIGTDDLATAERFSSPEARRNNQEELDAIIAQWTSTYDNRQLMELLQARGIPAGVVLNAEGTHKDPQLKFRNHFWTLRQSVVGDHTYDAHAFRFSKTPAVPRMAAPSVGEHNEYVYKTILGFSDNEYDDLKLRKIID